MKKIAKILSALEEMIKVSFKDVDNLRDNGGKVERDDSNRPGRPDKRVRYNPREIMPDGKDDAKEVNLDPDLRQGDTK